jgi:hypothetical protein
MWAFFMSVGFENFLQRLTVLTTLNVSILGVGMYHADGPWMILVRCGSRYATVIYEIVKCLFGFN